jgi:hypothetical protein
MRVRVSVLAMLAIALMAMPLLAGQYVDPLSKTAPAFAKVGLRTADKALEGFEGAFPPAGWTQTITNAAYTWKQDSVSPYEGAYAAYVPYDFTQNEVLSFPAAITAAESYLTFAAMGSVYWCSNADLTVEVNGLTVWSFCANATASWTWAMYGVDLSSYIGQTVTIAFRYAGDDGADQYLDAVQLGAPPAPPPVACDNAKPLACEDGLLSGDTCDGYNYLSTLGCASYTEAGLEHWYAVTLAPGGNFAATVTYTAKDGALWILDACQAPTNANCLAFADDTFSGQAEVVSYANTGTTNKTIYLVVDSWGAASCGAYTGTYSCSGSPVAIDRASWGGLKTLYR